MIMNGDYDFEVSEWEKQRLRERNIGVSITLIVRPGNP